MSTRRLILSLFASSMLLGGCGLAVPEIQEIPGDTAYGHKLVEAIVKNIQCEMQDAVQAVYKHHQHMFLDKWGVQMTLTLTEEETGAVSPNANWLPPSPANAVFNLNVGASASSDATRTDTINLYYLVDELRQGLDCHSRGGGPFLLQSDLKLKQWLFDALGADEDGKNFNDVLTQYQDAISHEVKFEVTTNANATPGWVLTRVTVNQTGPFLNASRDRTHDLIITFGPTSQPTITVFRGSAMRAVPGPSLAAQNTHLASQIGLAIANNIRVTVRP
jgi:hypothetical protein